MAISFNSPAAGTLYADRWVLSGAPGMEDDDSAGRAYALSTDQSIGVLNTLDDEEMVPPAGSSYYQFGWSVAGGDIRECRATGVGLNHDGCGQEFLVGAPDTFIHDGPGKVYWWEADGDDIGSLIQYGGEIPAPPGLTAGAEFGYQIAVAHDLSIEIPPWDGGVGPAQWVAISSPGDNSVLLFEVDPSSTTPLTFLYKLVGPLSGKGYGKALAVGDFDGDGVDDLAVGAPEPNASFDNGSVFVYKGTGVSALPIDTVDVLTLSGPSVTLSSDQNRYGAALAAGPFIGSASGDALLIGAPLYEFDDRGAICQVELSHDPKAAVGSRWSSVEDCWTNTNTSNAYENMGSSVAVGNFLNLDSLDRESTELALVPEVAVGFPGGRSDDGYVLVFRTDDSGVVYLSYLSQLQPLTGAPASRRFGERMASGWIQETDWQDVVIGAPGDAIGVNGSWTLSRANDTGSANVNGIYETVDGKVNDVRFRVAENPSEANTRLTLVSDLALAVTDSTGASCLEDEDGDGVGDVAAFVTLPAGFSFLVPVLGTTTGTSFVANLFPAFESILDPAVQSVFAELDYAQSGTGTASLTIGAISAVAEVLGVPVTFQWPAILNELDILDPTGTCALSPNPIALNRIQIGVCE